MPEIQKISIALTGEQVSVIKGAVASGEYATSSEVVREALRDWQRKRELHDQDLQRLQRLWAEGIGSGQAVKANLDDIRHKAQQRLRRLKSGKKSRAN